MKALLSEQITDTAQETSFIPFPGWRPAQILKLLMYLFDPQRSNKLFYGLSSFAVSEESRLWAYVSSGSNPLGSCLWILLR